MPQNPSPSFSKSLIDCVRRASTAIPLALIAVLFLLLPQEVVPSRPVQLLPEVVQENIHSKRSARSLQFPSACCLAIR